MYGVNLKLRFPFYAAMIGSGVASVYLGMTHVLAVALGSNSVLGFISIASHAIPAFIISGVISFVVSFTVTFVLADAKKAHSKTDSRPQRTSH